MRIAFQVALGLLIGAGTLYPGLVVFFTPANVFTAFFDIDLSLTEPGLRLAIESEVRLLAGMWIAAGTCLLLALRHFEKQTLLIRCVLAGLVLSAIGELLAASAVTGSMQPELMASGVTIGICLVLEAWRVYLVRKSANTE